MICTEKPKDGVTKEQPFLFGTGGSENFRIPGIVTLNDGTVVASCDARWNGVADSAGLDTIVSWSKDNGATWNYTFANYLGDNGNERNLDSTCFIDPGIATNGTEIYLIADLFPAGYATNSSMYNPRVNGIGFDENGNLLLRSIDSVKVPFRSREFEAAAHEAEYLYYLAYTDETKSSYSIYERATGAVVEGYSVDLLFNVTYRGEAGDTVTSNLFFYDCPYQVFPTNYLYMTTSVDGQNWSVPTLLNLKRKEEATLLVGPGNGTYDKKNNRFIFTAYQHSPHQPEFACLIWRDENGNWKRTENATIHTWSSESTSVVLADGTVRCFYRDELQQLRYTDFIYDAERGNYYRNPEQTEVSTKATKTTCCQLSSILYSKKIDGKDAIVICTPNASGRTRSNGQIYVFLVEEDNSMNLAYSYAFNSEFYAYSCLTELSDGRIAILWESADARITYSIVSMEDILSAQ